MVDIEAKTTHGDYKPCIDESGFREMVAVCAYFKAEKRGFVPGLELQDWLEAEQETKRRCFYWFEES